MANYPDDDKPLRRAERAPWGAFPAVVRNAELGALEKEPEYRLAKAGDWEAAYAMIHRLVTTETLDAVHTLVQAYPNTQVVPVLAQEASGRNKIPLAFAEVLAHHLDLTVERRIVQCERVFRTNAKADHRLAFQPTFSGPVTPNQAYFIVDDTITMGGTLASLRGYLANRGGHVLGAGALTAHVGALRLPVEPSMLDRITAKHGTAMNDFWIQEFSYGIDQLTQAEAGHLRAAASVDAIRDRIASARDAARWPADGREVEAGSSQAKTEETLTLTPLASYRAQQLARGEAVYGQAQHAFWSTGSSLPALRTQVEQRAVTLGESPKAALDHFWSHPDYRDLAHAVHQAVERDDMAPTRLRTLQHAKKHLDRQRNAAQDLDLSSAAGPPNGPA